MRAIFVQFWNPEMKQTFEKSNCKVAERFVHEINGQIVIYKRKDFETLYEEMTYLTHGYEASFIKEWFLDKNKRKYDLEKRNRK